MFCEGSVGCEMVRYSTVLVADKRDAEQKRLCPLLCSLNLTQTLSLTNFVYRTFNISHGLLRFVITKANLKPSSFKKRDNLDESGI